MGLMQFNIFMSLLYLTSCFNLSEASPGSTFTRIIEQKHVAINTLLEYAYVLQNKTKLIENIVSSFEKYFPSDDRHAKTSSNPLRMYKIMKLVTVDWQYAISQLAIGLDEGRFRAAKDLFQGSLENEGLQKTIRIFERVRLTYGMTVEDVSKGKLIGHETGVLLTSVDCFIIGVCNYSYQSYQNAIEWILKAKLLHKTNTLENIVSLPLILQFMSLTHEIGDGYMTLGEVLLKSKEHLSSETFLYFSLIIENCKYSTGFGVEDHLKEEDDKFLYEKLCRGETVPHALITKYLKCKYKTGPEKFLIIAPLKMEELHLDPYLVKFHGIVSDSEIRDVINTTRTNMKHSNIQWVDGDEERKIHSVQSDVRLSQTAWLRDIDSRSSEALSRRLEDMTDMNLKYSEPWQICFYDVGGRFDLHTDNNYGNINFESLRYMSVLLYLSDVTLGGSTVFPWMDIEVKPSKGTAIAWINVAVDGSQDEWTLHAGCPVVIGTKWVAIRWINCRGQRLVTGMNQQFEVI